MRQTLKVCKGCNLERKIWSKGLCIRCSNKTTTPMHKSTLKSKFKKKKDGGYSEFYKSQIELHSEYPISLATGMYIGEVGAVNIAHIFPKESYKSVSRNPQNIILLTWEEHTRFDNLLNVHNFSRLEIEFAGCWKEVCRRVKILLPLLTERGILMTKFKEYIDAH